jgi:site-specific recombinase XerC
MVLVGAVTRHVPGESSRGCEQHPSGTPPKALDKLTLRKLLRVARSHPRDYAMLEMLAGTGLRVGELLLLKVGDVELGERSGKVIVRRGKHEHYRAVPLTLDVRKALGAYLEAYHPEQDNPETPLWIGTHGELNHRSSVTRRLEKYAIQAGLESVNPHALRHTFATRASLNTVLVYTEPNLADLTQRMERVAIVDQ